MGKVLRKTQSIVGHLEPVTRLKRAPKNFVELFAGIGLVRLGLEKVGWNCVFANDIDPQKQAIYALNFGDDHFRLEDIWKLSAEDIPGGIDLITASFPCIDLSLAGNRNGLSGDHSGTFWALVHILQDLAKRRRAPKAVLVENVTGFLSLGNGKHVIEAVKALNDCGYWTDAFILDAKNFVPQSRPRLFILGLAKDLASEHMLTNDRGSNFLRFFQTLDESTEIRPANVRRVISENPGLKWGLLDFPRLPTRKDTIDSFVEILPEEDDRWWPKAKVEKLLSQMSTNHRERIRQLAKSTTPKYVTVYRRVRNEGSRAEIRTDGIAGCLRTPRGGSSKQILLVASKEGTRVRWMTAREYARLMGVNDDFRLPDNPVHAYFGFGDAVCVPVVSWLGQHVLNRVLG